MIVRVSFGLYSDNELRLREKNHKYWGKLGKNHQGEVVYVSVKEHSLVLLEFVDP